MSKRARSDSVDDDDERQVKWAALGAAQEKLQQVIKSLDFFDSTMDVAMFEREILPLMAGSAFLRDSELPANFTQRVYWQNRDSQVALWRWREVSTTWKAFIDKHRHVIQPPTLANVMEYFIAHDQFLEYASLHMPADYFNAWKETEAAQQGWNWNIEIHPECELREALEFVYRNEPHKLRFALGRLNNPSFPSYSDENAELFWWDDADVFYDMGVLEGGHELHPWGFEMHPEIRRRLYRTDSVEQLHRMLAETQENSDYNVDILEIVLMDVENNFDCFGPNVSEWLFKQTRTYPNLFRWRMLMPLFRHETLALFTAEKKLLERAWQYNKTEMVRLLTAARHFPATDETAAFIGSLIQKSANGMLEVTELVFQWVLSSFRWDLLAKVLPGYTVAELQTVSASFGIGENKGLAVIRPFKPAIVRTFKQVEMCAPYLGYLKLDFSPASDSKTLFIPQFHLDETEMKKLAELRLFDGLLLNEASATMVFPAQQFYQIKGGELTGWNSNATTPCVAQIVFDLVELQHMDLNQIVSNDDDFWRYFDYLKHTHIKLIVNSHTIDDDDPPSAVCNILCAILRRLTTDIYADRIGDLVKFANLFSVRRRINTTTDFTVAYASTGVQAVLKAIFAYLDRYNAAKRLLVNE